MRRYIPAVVLSAIILAVGFGVGIASASIPDPSGVIHACYKIPVPAHGTPLNVIDTNGGSCAGGTTEVTWNQTGPQGPTGPTGPTGPQGPAGPSTGGPTGLDLTTVTNTVDAGTVTVFCPADHPYLFGGGGSGGSNRASFPIVQGGQQGWEVSDQIGVSVTAYAICGK